MWMLRRGLGSIVVLLMIGTPGNTQEPAEDLGPPKVFINSSTAVLAQLTEERAPTPAGIDDPAGMLDREQTRRLREANVRENAAWARIDSREAWEQYRDVRIRAMEQSLGRDPQPEAPLRVRETGEITGPGYRITNLVFESRPGLVVTANLYRPAKPTSSMPGVLICHSHHRPKVQNELQDMGMTWARQGCAVLIMDQLGHGERRQHPFESAEDYPRPFRPDRQDYYFRYNSGLQLHLIGDSLIGWMVHDLRRGVDLLLSLKGIDRERIIMLGAVAGGGDPVAVTAALDDRITAVVPFNFGGPQPDYAIPENAERDFYYFGVAYWESTRCLRLGARDGFANWVIVGAIAPRRLIYAHEFAWDAERDPVWERFQRIYRWYDAEDRLATVKGRGSVRGRPPESTHCTNIGPIHRAQIYPILQRWFDMPSPDAEWLDGRHEPSKLLCQTPEVDREWKPRPVHELALQIADERLQHARDRRAKLPPKQRLARFQQEWAELLGGVEPVTQPKIKPVESEANVERFVVTTEPGIVVPVCLLVPSSNPDRSKSRPVVVAVAEAGQAGFLKHRSESIESFLQSGIAVCLCDPRGCGETQPGTGRHHNAAATSRSATELLLGGTILGGRVRDLRTVLGVLRKRADIDAKQIMLWGDSFAPTNEPGAELAVPLRIDAMPHIAEPGGPLLALVTALYEPDLRGVFTRGGLSSFRSMLESPFIYLPHDAVIPAALTVGDLSDVMDAVGRDRVMTTAPVDARNRPVSVPNSMSLLDWAQTRLRP